MQTRWQSDKERLLQPAPDKGLPLARPASPVPFLHKACSALFFIMLPAVFFFRYNQPEAVWPLATLLFLAFLTTVVSQCRTLPGQNVIVATFIILAMSAFVIAIGALNNLPFGPFVYTDDAGPCLLQTVPWVLPLLWVTILLTARGVARLILRPWRKSPAHGWLALILASGLAAAFDLALDPFATHVQYLWVWQTAGAPGTWYGMPWINSIGWFLVSFFILGCAAPWLINKRPVQFPPDFHPMFVWLGLSILVGILLLLNSLWLAAAVAFALTFIVTTLALSYAQG